MKHRHGLLHRARQRLAYKIMPACHRHVIHLALHQFVVAAHVRDYALGNIAEKDQAHAALADLGVELKDLT